MRRSALLLIGAALLVAGCGSPFSGAGNSTADQGFHPGTPGNVGETNIPPQLPPVAVGEKRGFKLGPGAVRAAGSAVSGVAVITNDQAKMHGSQVNGRFAFSRKGMR